MAKFLAPYLSLAKGPGMSYLKLGQLIRSKGGSMRDFLARKSDTSTARKQLYIAVYDCSTMRCGRGHCFFMAWMDG